MSTFRSKFISAAIMLICFAAGSSSRIFLDYLKNKPSIGENSKEIVFSLLNNRKTNKSDCASEFIATYIDWSFKETPSSEKQFICEGGRILQCTWTFGKSTSNETWSKILRFKYDATAREVDPSSISCLDIP